MKTPMVVRLFSDIDGETIELFGYIAGMDRAEFSARFPGVKGRAYDSKRLQVAKDNAGRILPVTRAIEFKKVRALHRCDARCLYARGHDCECQCGGVNHGRGDAGAQVDMFTPEPLHVTSTGFYEDKNARADEVAADFALEFMGGSLDLGGEQMGLGGDAWGEESPRRAPDSRQPNLF